MNLAPHIRDIMTGRGGMMTYVIRNWLDMDKGFRVTTDQVRKALVALEEDGRVRRVPSNYSRQICWQWVK